MTTFVDTLQTLPATGYQYSFPDDTDAWVAVENVSASSVTISFNAMRALSANPVIVDPGQPYVGRAVFYLVTITGTGSLVHIRISDKELATGKVTMGNQNLPPSQDPSGFLIHKLQGNETVYETEGGINGYAMGNGVAQSGSTRLPVGTLVNYTLGVTGYGISTGVNAYIIIQGHVSGNNYAVCIGPQSIAQGFTMPSYEKLDVLYTNNAAVANLYSWTWQGTSP